MARASMVVLKAGVKVGAVVAAVGAATVESAASARRRDSASGPRPMRPRVRVKVQDRPPTTCVVSNVRSVRHAPGSATAAAGASVVNAARARSAHRARSAASRNGLTRQLTAATSNVKAVNSARRVNHAMTVDRNAARAKMHWPDKAIRRANRQTAGPPR